MSSQSTPPLRQAQVVRQAAASAVRRSASAGRLVRRDPWLALLLVRTYLLLIVMRGVISVFTLKAITERLGAKMDETSHECLTDDQRRFARRVAWSVARTSPFTPTNSNCYPQALTARFLLHRRRIPTTIYYGAAFARSGDALDTHVWLRCGPAMVTGAPAHLRYAIVSKFADHVNSVPRQPNDRPLRLRLKTRRAQSVG